MKNLIAPVLALAALAILASPPLAQSGPEPEPFGPRWCRGNLLSNGEFSAGMVLVGDGSMPGSKVSDWTAAHESPQVRAGPGCGDSKGLISMWGNQAVSEAIQQKLKQPLVKGKTYRFSACVRWLENKPKLPKYVRFRVRAGSTLIGTTPNITSKSWARYTLPDWKATGNFETITINPENDYKKRDGETVSWGQIDRVCLREVQPEECPNNLLRNGSFADGMVLIGDGSMPESKVSDWTAASRSPNVRAGPGCGESEGFISMWGNLVVGEAIQQKLKQPLVRGKTYRFSACARWLKNKPKLPKYVRFRVRASGPSGATLIGTTPNITSTAWTTYTLADWTPTRDYDTITISPENDHKKRDGATVSWGQIDNVCLREVRVRRRKGRGQ